MSSARVLVVTRKLDRARHLVDLLFDRPETLAPALVHLEAIESASEAFIAALQPGAGPVKLLEAPELWESLATAIVAIARARRSARLNATDLKDLVENHAPARDLAFWVKQYPGRVVGLLRNVPEIRKLVEPYAVLFWEMWEDEQWRIVDSHWLESHADIRRWVTDPWPGGRYCRFCACQENPHVNALLSVEVERRNGLQMIGDTVVLQVGGALTHDPCRPFWIQWCAIAAKYPTQEAAEEADKIAGRESRYAKVLQTARLGAATDE
jgi:hypothetical protein